ncbi:MAG: hypothetical protein ABIS29_04135 [Vicinamibacterales bacterium]
MSYLLSTVLAVVSLMLLSLPAVAQGTNPRGPSGGLFGATRPDVEGADRLNFTFDVAEGFESDVPSEQGVAVVGGGLGTGGFSTLFGGSSTYARRGRRLQLAASASTAFKYYQRIERLDPLSHGASIGLGLRLPKQGKFEITQAAAYSPSYLYQLFPQVNAPELGALIPLNPDYQIDQRNSSSYSTRAAVNYGAQRGTQFSTFGEYTVTAYQNEAAREDAAAVAGLETRSIGTRLSRAITSRASFASEYRYRTGEFEFKGSSQEHEARIGVEYSPPLSASRRLTIRLNAAPAWLKFPAAALATVVTATTDQYLFRLQGDGYVSYPFRRNWLAAAAYDRGVQYLVGLPEPLLSDSVRAQLTGLISRRVDLSASAAYFTAESGIPGSSQNLDTYTGTVKIRYAFTRSVAMYSEYLYYYYDQGQSSLVPGLPSVFEQHGIRVGVALFTTVLGR